jgi:hypothetical protein
MSTTDGRVILVERQRAKDLVAATTNSMGWKCAPRNEIPRAATARTSLSLHQDDNPATRQQPCGSDQEIRRWR